MIHLPTTIDEALSLTGELRAGGTDLQDRRHLPVFRGPVIDLRDLDGLAGIGSDATQAWIGGKTTLQTIADHPGLATRWPGIADACGALANPQIRAVATIAGNLMQKPRCWYYRHPEYDCLRKGGDTCFARGGDHLFHVAFDTEPCAAPHASTVGMALIAYEAEVEYVAPGIAGPQRVGVLEVLREGGLPEGGLITAVKLGAPVPEERSAYVRASNRSRAEWALVEVTVRLVIDQGTISFARVAAGAVAPTPLRLTKVEAALVGKQAEPAVFEEAAALASEGAKPLPQTAYKLDLLRACVLEALERALEREPAVAGVAPAPETKG